MATTSVKEQTGDSFPFQHTTEMWYECIYTHNSCTSTDLTPEAEILHFGFKIPDVGYLWPILTVEKAE